MSATIRIPDMMSSHTDGCREIAVSGTTLAAVIEDLAARHPGIRQELCDERGSLLRFLAVFVDGSDVRSLQGLATPVGPDAEIEILAAFAGG
jgi:molybdopterin synthase sulfur carrier subunit